MRPDRRGHWSTNRYNPLIQALLATSVLSYGEPGMAASRGDPEIQKLKKQLQQYQEQLSATLQRLSDLEERNAVVDQIVRAKEDQDSKKKSLGTSVARYQGEPATGNTSAAESRNIQAQPDTEDPLKSGVPKSRYLNGFYDGGFSLRTKDNRFSITINGLAQGRYTLNLPNQYYGNQNQTFDLALGRLFFSGTAFDPNISYFFFYQTSTLSNSNRVDTIDWWGRYQFDNLGIKAGRILPLYTRQFYNDIGKYLFMDLEETEYAFSLQRTPGAEVAWKNDGLTLSLTAGNSVRALDATGEQNSNYKLAGIARANYDILDPYTYVQETIPKVVDKPQLSVGAAFGYNPIDSSSSLQNTINKMDTMNGTLDFGYRYQYFSAQASAYIRGNSRPRGTGPATSTDYGWYVQSGYFLLPERLELGVKANQIAFDYNDGSPFKNQYVGAVGLNYYFYEHNFKLQSDYSHISGYNWIDQPLIDNRIRLQGQIYF